MVIIPLELLNANKTHRNMAPDVDPAQNRRGPRPFSKCIHLLRCGLFCINMAPLQVSALKIGLYSWYEYSC
jgi:hypothetical protein